MGGAAAVAAGCVAPLVVAAQVVGFGVAGCVIFEDGEMEGESIG